ncbi:hypothetical protein CfE428DRAFT_5608 [Chthoniobacter flavus Ellin428]|uniref:Uncharacterized protein n=1 Tax=Chthoniobacter flavus Ellin428 TaxID=497964 RepID=B4D9L8_9BACT|nr:hypothetical protein [Chthoniobacter flavus]EDY16799.1 hypothetical protein CfE428DRAFT_5608 [Chthoniobacter flavus Ellin428]TCO93376.1 hypothetical protein EV701_10480 [Chthoniobacter flavus]
MPDDPPASTAKNIIAAIHQLSKRSAELRESAKKNGIEANRLASHIALLQRELERIIEP